MLDFDESKLRAQVVYDYELLAQGITGADEMNRFVDAVVTTAVGTVREKLSELNQLSFMGRIPPEVLAACFTYLPLHTLIRTSHVCRSWRAAAVSYSSLWARITSSSPFGSLELLQMVLSRTGALPLDLKVDSQIDATPEAVFAAIAPFSRRLRYLAWYFDQPAEIPWEFVAPKMEHFCSHSTLTITERFLGGLEGRLRAMSLQCTHFPAICPPLATVSDLSVALTPFDDSPPSTLVNLFDLFPRLEVLQVEGIAFYASEKLPVGPSPTSLRELSLHSADWTYDLMPLCLAWDSGNLCHIALQQYPGALPDLERLARGTVRLAVQSAASQSKLMFEHSAAVSHSISISSVALSDTAALLARVQSSLNAVHTAMVSHVALEPLAGVLTALPMLEHLVLHIVPTGIVGSSNVKPHPHGFEWTPLACLADLSRAMRRLRSITLHVWCSVGWRARELASAPDAQGLISQLRALEGDLPPIEIQGFPAAEVASIDLTGLNARFDVTAKVGEISFHQHREARYPFQRWLDSDMDLLA
ncbi:hypothetical protein AURDEDRAFT_187250 [Auricularia subglabra TFB-10046 SS5]|uniref:F-box domain-containing protein n=1 Tax=Auricularia subglabra (strain TFB-10046 / SS5) TaxID=717982 RepID=J0D1N3_AURST|nr:hypothetical protein AURDEDRAFT_187250 [Auricularia subglabra TFB-10046 SS5]